MDKASEPRYFAVDSAGVTIDVLKTAGEQVVASAETMLIFQRFGITDEQVPAMLEAMEIMRADDVPEKMIGELLLACHQSSREPVGFARHFVKLRKAIR